MTAKPLALTIFATPKAFRGHIDVIQRNAITSWTRLQPRVQIILFGGESGTAEVARELGVGHIAEVICSGSGAPRLDDLFGKAELAVADGLLCYVNADIMLMDDFMAAAARLAGWSPVMMIGRRWDTDIAKPWHFQDPDWQGRLRDFVGGHGRQQSAGAIDYFLFTKGLGRDLLPLALGRTLWDHWLVWNARKKGAAIVDASAVVVAVHQNHDYAHHPQGHDGVWRGEEAKQNRKLIGDANRLITIDDASHRMTANSIVPAYRHVWRTIAYGWRHPRAFAKRLALGLARPFGG
jgi:hypothetical protein